MMLQIGLMPMAHAGPKLTGFKMVQQDNLMLHLDLDSTDARAKPFTLSNHDRLVIDLLGATLGTELPDEEFDTGLVKGVRYSQHGDEYLRVVVDLRAPVDYSYRIVQRQGGQRLIVDMGMPANALLSDSQPDTMIADRQRDVIIAIDAGHGGKDPGAIGRNNTYEKDVVLAIAIRLHNQLVAVPGIRPVLIRDSDVFVELRERLDRARRANADMFVSIHADAIDREGANGSSVYALSLDGASSEAAAWLAKRENEAAALYGEVSLGELEDSLAQTLLNLTQGNTMERSIEVGYDVLQELGKIGSVHKSTVEQAAFAVLKSPDIPSILVETAFISNRAEEKKLNSPDYQEQLAIAIGQGLYNFLLRRAPAGTFFSSN